MSLRLTGLPPVVGPGTRLLVLGSFPGLRSLQLRQYYAHPQNHFWRILQALWPDHPLPPAYPARCKWLLARGMGLWDVYASCEREGSLDTAIRAGQLNDFASLCMRCPALLIVAHNGGESYRHAPALRAALSALSEGTPATGTRGIAPGFAAPTPFIHVPAIERLPSTSPANASWSFERKLEAWRRVARAAGLQPRG